MSYFLHSSRILFMAAAFAAMPLAATAQERVDVPAASSTEAPGAAMPDLRSAMPDVSGGSGTAVIEISLGAIPALNSDDLIGSKVRNSSNEVLGQVDSLLLSTDAQVIGVVVATGGFLGFGAHHVAVPMDQISMIDDDNVSLPSATKESLKAAPAYERASGHQAAGR